LNIQGVENKLPINDKKLYPLYAKCIVLDIPVNIHVSINFLTQTLMSYGHPGNLDEVMDHPGGKQVINLMDAAPVIRGKISRCLLP